MFFDLCMELYYFGILSSLFFSIDGFRNKRQKRPFKFIRVPNLFRDTGGTYYTFLWSYVSV